MTGSFDEHRWRELAGRQEMRQQAAGRILAALDPLGRWAVFGEPVLCGAAAYGLLVKPDIDIEIYGDLDPTAGFVLLQDWARNKAVRRSLFINAVGQQDAGLGWEVRYLEGELTWTVQMWLLAEDYAGPRSANLAHPLRQALTPYASCAILDLKEQHVACALPYRSIDLYRAVLDDGVETMEEFDRWKQSNSSTGLLEWAPTAR